MGRPPRERNILQGDIVVTAVAGVYAIGRITGDGGIQEPLGSEQSRTQALKRACVLAGATHCVFLYPSTGTPVRPDPPPCPRCHKTTAVVEVGQSALSSRWFICHSCSKIWSSPPRRPRGEKR